MATNFARTSFARLGAPGVGQPVQDRVAVLAAEPLERHPRGGPRVELALEILGNPAARLALVCRLPAAVGLGALDLRQPRRAHPPVRDQPFGCLAIDPRPPAARASRREAL